MHICKGLLHMRLHTTDKDATHKQFDSDYRLAYKLYIQINPEPNSYH